MKEVSVPVRQNERDGALLLPTSGHTLGHDLILDVNRRWWFKLPVQPWLVTVQHNPRGAETARAKLYIVPGRWSAEVVTRLLALPGVVWLVLGRGGHFAPTWVIRGFPMKFRSKSLDVPRARE